MVPDSLDRCSTVKDRGQGCVSCDETDLITVYCTVLINEGAPPYFDKIGSTPFPCKQDPSVLYSATPSVSTSWIGKVKEIDAHPTLRFR
jgi:hypothetical protein